MTLWYAPLFKKCGACPQLADFATVRFGKLKKGGDYIWLGVFLWGAGLGRFYHIHTPTCVLTGVPELSEESRGFQRRTELYDILWKRKDMTHDRIDVVKKFFYLQWTLFLHTKYRYTYLVIWESNSLQIDVRTSLGRSVSCRSDEALISGHKWFFLISPSQPSEKFNQRVNRRSYISRDQ